MKKIDVEVKWSGREEARFLCELDQAGNILNPKLSGVGGPQFLEALVELRKNLKGNMMDVKVASGNGPAEMLLRELIMRAQGKWEYPFLQDELCHCRAVPTATVDMAICTGAHSAKKVTERTSASSACGTCRPDVEAIIKFRLGS